MLNNLIIQLNTTSKLCGKTYKVLLKINFIFGIDQSFYIFGCKIPDLIWKNTFPFQFSGMNYFLMFSFLK